MLQVDLGPVVMYKILAVRYTIISTYTVLGPDVDNRSDDDNIQTTPGTSLAVADENALEAELDTVAAK